ncbi:(deoxy)nucleoside triphosphate pyrophosphohydrolase [Williamsia sp. CHRR-6]|uniref:(deoxy)nucleoside triphosphate pyrophosphohydrolase n=1 Tax=Williamsia sp. CHRR-6 TaxID=2835871 RepID=UPI001BDB39DC|nr:NUDIX domain-containing protein [Williamsia sp. CHRR-6]MBT0565535.1 NUDIX domain-containing protein [Williamsia sp. CHRR-6]
MTREVVAGAVFGGGRLLLAQRARPAHLAGLWELPGGKVEPGETRSAALGRELVEELGIEVRVGSVIGDPVPLADDLVLIALAAELLGGEPTAGEHLAVRWVDADQLRVMAAEGTLVPADRTWLPDLIALLTG